MKKFKKGDRVKVIRESSINLGCEGIVTHTFPDSRSYTVDLDDMGSVAFAESSLTLVDQPLSTTPGKVLQAAKTSPQAKDALKALFPDVFKDEALEIYLDAGKMICQGVFVGNGQNGKSRTYIIAHPNVDVRLEKTSDVGTILTFHKKP